MQEQRDEKNHSEKIGRKAADKKAALYAIGNLVKSGAHATHNFLYVIGVQSVRIIKKLFRKIRRFLRPVAVFTKKIYFWGIGKRVLAVKKEFLRLKHGFSIAKKRFSVAQKHGAGSVVLEFFKVAGHGLVKHRNIFSTLFHIAAPVAGVIVLVVTINYWSNQNLALVLEYDGQTLGYVSDESVYDQATNMVSARVAGSTNDFQTTTAPTFTLTTVDNVKYVTASNVCDKIIESSNGVIEEATGLYVDGDYVAAAKSTTDLKFVLQTILKNYRVEQETDEVEFTKDIQLIEGYYPSDNIKSVKEIEDTLTGKTEVEEYYTVGEGETAFAIALKHNMEYAELERLNPDLKPEFLQTGQKLKIASAKTFLAVQVVKQETYTKPIAFETVKQESNQYTVGTSKVTVTGKNGEMQYVDKVIYVDGVEVGRENVSQTVVTQPVTQKVLVGTKKKSTAVYRPTVPTTTTSSTQPSTGQFMYPALGSQGISRRYGYSYGAFHGAVDFMAPAGSTVVAADAGMVISAQWDAGYGWCMAIRHDNGLVTFYAHCSRLYVGAGIRVSKGQQIAAVGNTGSWSRGNHLHFEVRVNGVKKNPLNYL